MDLKRISKAPISLFISFIVILWITIIGFIVSINVVSNNYETKFINNWLINLNNNLTRTINHINYKDDQDFKQYIHQRYENEINQGIVISIFKQIQESDTIKDKRDISYFNYIMPNSLINSSEFYHFYTFCTDNLAPREKSDLSQSVYMPDKKLLIFSELRNRDQYFYSIHKPINIAIIAVIVFGLIATAIVSLLFFRYFKDMNKFLHYLKDIASSNDVKPPTPYLYKEFNRIAQNVYARYLERKKMKEEQDMQREFSIRDEKDKLRAKRILSNNLHHEIKTPIGILQGYIETMLHHDELDATLRQKFLSKCFDNVQRLNNLVTSISLITRLDDGSQAIVIENVNVHKVVNTLLDDILIQLKAKKFKFTWDIPENTYVKSNSSFFYTVLHNLIRNAMNYSNGNEIVFKKIKENHESITFTLYDNGDGVPQEYLPFIFERFYRVDKGKSRNLGGSGLGLAIVENIIILSGGTIEVSNRKEGGLMFIFTLPKID